MVPVYQGVGALRALSLPGAELRGSTHLQGSASAVFADFFSLKDLDDERREKGPQYSEADLTVRRESAV